MTGYPYKQLGWVHVCGVYVSLNIKGNVVISRDPGNPDEPRHALTVVKTSQGNHLEVV